MIRNRFLFVLYVLAAVLALVLTWYHVPAYLGKGVVEANRLFWADALFNSNPAGRFLTVDVLFLAFVCSVFMYIEGRRLNIRYLHAYVIAGILVAISVAFPLFLAARELKLTGTQEDTTRLMNFADVLFLLLLFLAATGAGVAVLTSTP